MMEKHVSKERWQALYGPAPEAFHAFVQYTVKATREAKPVKRFTARTVILAALILILLMGITYAATKIFGTMNYLEEYTSAPQNGAGVTVQNNLKQTACDFPNFTVTVRDAVYDGAIAFVTVAYTPKNPDKDIMLPREHTTDQELSFAEDRKEWLGFTGTPLTDVMTDTRRKLVLFEDNIKTEGVRTLAERDSVYEQDGMLVQLYKIWMSRDAMQYYQTNDKDKVEPVVLQAAQDLLSNNEPLDITFTIPVKEWSVDAKTEYNQLYNCEFGITLKKSGKQDVRVNETRTGKGDMILTKVMLTFTELATYGQISVEVPVSRMDIDKFHLLDQSGVEYPIKNLTLGTFGEPYYSETRQQEVRIFTLYEWWPAITPVPFEVMIQAGFLYGDPPNRFTIPLVSNEDTGAPSPTPSPMP